MTQKHESAKMFLNTEKVLTVTVFFVPAVDELRLT